MDVLFGGESPAPNVGPPASFSSTDALQWTKEEAANDLPHADRDALVRVQVEVACVVEHEFRPAEIHEEWKPHCGDT